MTAIFKVSNYQTDFVKSTLFNVPTCFMLQRKGPFIQDFLVLSSSIKYRVFAKIVAGLNNNEKVHSIKKLEKSESTHSEDARALA